MDDPDEDQDKSLDDDDLAKLVACIRSAQTQSLAYPEAFTRGTPWAEDANEAARLLLMNFCNRALSGEQQSPVTVEWLKDAFISVLEYEHPTHPLQSFGLLPRSKGRQNNNIKSFDVAAWVLLTIRRGYTRRQAKEMAASTFQIELRTVEANLRDSALTDANLTNDESLWEARFNSASRSRRARPLPPRRSKS